MDKVYLAPCPFCAGGAETDEFDLYDGYQGCNTVCHVRCRECGAEVQADSYDEAVKKWNRRAAKLMMVSMYGSLVSSTPVFTLDEVCTSDIPLPDLIKRIQKMTAREYIDISYRMFREDDRAWDELVVCEEKDPEKAIMMAKRWAQEHPEERSE